MNDIHSLPDSLREQIQEAAQSILPTSSSMNILPPGDPLKSGDPLKLILTEIARQSPELFAALIIGNNNCSGIETIETEETIENRVVTVHSHAYGTETKVQPIKTQRTIRRQVRFLTEQPMRNTGQPLRARDRRNVAPDT